MLSSDKDREFAITDEVHEAFIFFVEKSLLLRRLLILSRVPCWVYVRLILLLHVDHVWSRENAVKLAHKLSDALIVFFHSDLFLTILGHAAAQCFHFGLYKGTLKLRKDFVPFDEVFECFLSNFALVDGRDLRHEVCQLVL